MKSILFSTLFISVTSFSQVGDSVKIEIVNLGKSINSTFEDYAPIISADAGIMLFTSNRVQTTTKERKSKKALEKIYFSTLKDNQSSNAEPFSTPVNQESRNNSAIALSNDGQYLLIYRDDENGNGDIWESRLKGDVWSEPVKIAAPINSEKHESSASISPDGNTIYFVSDREKGIGKRDIWYSRKNHDGTWGTAVNLGKIVNTPEDEEGIFIHPDGKTLYFSSKGHDAGGQYDIFKTVFENEEWSKPINLGKPINTPNNDLFFVMAADGKKAYYSSSDQKDNLGGKDIYEIHFLHEQDTKSPSLTLLKGTVSDSISEELLGAKIIIADNLKNSVVSEISSNSVSGNYLCSLPSGKNYNITVHLEGYLFYSTNIEITESSEYQEVVKNIRLKKIEVGNKAILKNIFFEYNQATLRNESYVELNNLYDLLIKNPNLILEISGHTDNIGNEAYNLNLSKERAHSVVEFLVSKGIDPSRLKYVGYGYQFPIATNATNEGRQLNRRVEFKVLSK